MPPHQVQKPHHNRGTADAEAEGSCREGPADPESEDSTKWVEQIKLHPEAEKIITAFAEYNNYNPFHQQLWKYYNDAFKAEVIYLQHGVLHAFLPWKYSKDRLNAID
mgnify:CR=1 FL=1